MLSCWFRRLSSTRKSNRRQNQTAFRPGMEMLEARAMPSATTIVHSDFHSTNSPAPLSMIEANGTLFYGGQDANHGLELWKSDGTPQGTALIADVNPANADGLAYSQLAEINGIVYF